MVIKAESLNIKKLSLAGFLISVGIVYGDIGTSPLYTFKAILKDAPVNKELILGSVSAIFWTLFFQTTLKYVFITLKADNKGEGGIFSLYTLIRRYKKWLLIPALLGGSFLIADSIITPPISVSSAVEGIKMYYPSIPTIPIVIGILTILFLVQAFGSAKIGKVFGPAMMVWFTMIGVMGFYALGKDFSVLKALNPVYAYHLIRDYPDGFWLLGGVFLCTTGAEALYSDLGHCGRKNIEVSWVYVKLCLVLCYFGQAAWLVNHEGIILDDTNSFFAMMPGFMFWPAIAVATTAAIIASQALISGTFTLFNEAIRLNFFPRLTIHHPSEVRGQLYIPAVNWALYIGCVSAVLFFKDSAHMEAAFGLSVTLTMLMTTILLTFYLYIKRTPILIVIILGCLFFIIEGSFLVANLKKFPEGGYITLLIGLFLFIVMFTWRYARNIKVGLLNFVDLKPHLGILKRLKKDEEINKYATHLAYLTNSNTPAVIEERIIQSIYFHQPKRADIYWFIHIDVTDEPYTQEYSVEAVEKNTVFYLSFKLGFRVIPRVTLLFKKVLIELSEERLFCLDPQNNKYCPEDIYGDYRFVTMKTFLSNENELPAWKKIPMNLYFIMKHIDISTEEALGLDENLIAEEKVPLIVEKPQHIHLKRVFKQ